MILNFLHFTFLISPPSIRMSPADMLIAFFTLFGGVINPRAVVISTRNGGQIFRPVSVEPFISFGVKDPQDLDHEIRGKATLHEDFMVACGAAADALRAACSPCDSLLARIFTPDEVKKLMADRAKNLENGKKFFEQKAVVVRPAERKARWNVIAGFVAQSVKAIQTRHKAPDSGHWQYLVWKKEHQPVLVRLKDNSMTYRTMPAITAISGHMGVELLVEQQIIEHDHLHILEDALEADKDFE
jgi:hypothetical protein